MKVIEVPNGRLGNGIFRYLASVILQMDYGAERLDTTSAAGGGSTIVIRDNHYADLLNSIDKNRALFMNATIVLDGYFQSDIYCDQRYKKRIIQFIKNHPEHIIYGTDLKHNLISNTADQLIREPEDVRKYDIVIHLRLEDFMNTDQMIHPDALINIIEDISTEIEDQRSPIAAIVCNKITTPEERKYVQYIYDHNKTPIKLLFESNDVITDFHIMKNARILVCSLSTLSWSAALLSEKVKKVYMPSNKGPSQSFLHPIENTIHYYNVFFDKKDLDKL